MIAKIRTTSGWQTRNQCLSGHVALCLLGATLPGTTWAGPVDWGFGQSTGTQPPASWKAQFHPKVPKHTEFELISMGTGPSWLKITAAQSYGSWALDWTSQAQRLTDVSWEWRVDQHPTKADPKLKSGDDAAVKVCFFVSVDESEIPLGKRLAIKAARTFSGQNLPAATLCYLFTDAPYAQQGWFANPFTDRVRSRVLRAAAAQNTAFTETRSVEQDAREAFGVELPEGPVKILGVAVGGDSDNTQSQSLAYFRWK